MREQIECVQTQFCKYVLKVGSFTADTSALGECGRLRLHVHYFAKVVKYWIRFQFNG